MRIAGKRVESPSAGRPAGVFRIVSALLDWFGQNARDLPWRRTRDPYAIWVSEVMLQQTQVKTVRRYWERWMRALPNLAALAKASPERIHKLWEGLGYYSRVRNLQKAAQLILKEQDGKFPESFEAVLALPGIGRYTAGAICSMAFNQPTPILDGNVMRVLTRLFGIDGNPREQPANALLWQLAEQLVQQAATHATPSACSHLNQSLMELGALVCAPRQPQCGNCPVARFCIALKQGRVARLPALGSRPRATSRRFIAFVAQKGGRFLVRQRPAGVVNAHLWEFPNLECAEAKPDLNRMANSVLHGTTAVLEPLCVIKHSITRYRILLEVFRVAGSYAAPPAPSDGRWLKLNEMRRLPFTGAHKKILHHLVTR
jgi:A/G-specific adenine glycosylase